MFVCYRRVIRIMGLTAEGVRQRNCSRWVMKREPSRGLSRLLDTSIRSEIQWKNSERRPKSSNKYSWKRKNGAKSTPKLRIFQIVRYRRLMTTVILMGMTSRMRLGTRAHVALAIRQVLYRLLSRDSNWSTEEKFPNFRCSSLCSVTTWTKAVMVDGLSSRGCSLRTRIWCPNSVHPTRPRPKAFSVAITKIVQLRPKLWKVTSSVGHMANPARKRWCKKCYMEASLMVSLVYLRLSALIQVAFFRMNMTPKSKSCSKKMTSQLITTICSTVTNLPKSFRTRSLQTMAWPSRSWTTQLSS